MASSSSSSSSSLVFEVQRHEPELVTPAKPTPYEFKCLSDIDDQEGLRYQLPVIQFYRHEPTMIGKDPVTVIRQALAEALVFYYPFAGRLREVRGRKLVVECTGEGVLFIEADADVRLEQFGDMLQPPFPCLKELLHEVHGSGGILGTPLLLIQVTRLMCGGFIFASRCNHTMTDVGGLAQFMSAVGEMACGAQAPLVSPVWKRELLNARNPHPSGVTFMHHEYDQLPDLLTISASKDEYMVYRSFFFGASEFTALRNCLPLHLRSMCSKFELLTACLWRCRTIAIQPDPEEEMRVMFTVSPRSKSFKVKNPQDKLHVGYYGNAFVFCVAATTTTKLCRYPLDYAIDLVKKAKANVTEEYMRSVTNLMVVKGRPHYTIARSTYLLTDTTGAGFRNVDFGWGKPIYGGLATAGIKEYDSLMSVYVSSKNHKGEDGILVPVNLPRPAMERFVIEIENMTNSFITSGM